MTEWGLVMKDFNNESDGYYWENEHTRHVRSCSPTRTRKWKSDYISDSARNEVQIHMKFGEKAGGLTMINRIHVRGCLLVKKAILITLHPWTRSLMN